jgi:hypothetical protein
MHERKKLSDILAGGNGNWINNNWDDIPAAPEFGQPIPSGKYLAYLKSKELFTARTGTPGCKLCFEICEGEHKGRLCWYDIWLSDAAKEGARRDFKKLGILNRHQLEQPLPAAKRIRCEIVVRIHKSDTTGEDYNVVKFFHVVGIDEVQADPFAPSPASGEGVTP